MNRRRLTFGAIVAFGLVVPASLAWACVAPVSLTTASPTVQPGGTITVIGRETAPGAPIELRMDSPDGPVLATVTGQPGGMSAKWEYQLTIPPNTPYGKHVIYAVQNYRNMNATIPRATIYVGTVPDPAPQPEPREANLDVGSGPSGTSLVLFGLAAAVGGLLFVGALSALAASRGGSRPQPAPVKGS